MIDGDETFYSHDCFIIKKVLQLSACCNHTKNISRSMRGLCKASNQNIAIDNIFIFLVNVAFKNEWMSHMIGLVKKNHHKGEHTFFVQKNA